MKTIFPNRYDLKNIGAGAARCQQAGAIEYYVDRRNGACQYQPRNVGEPDGRRLRSAAQFLRQPLLDLSRVDEEDILFEMKSTTEIIHTRRFAGIISLRVIATSRM